MTKGDNMTQKLNKEIVLEMWSKTYNKEGKPDWSHIFPFYHQEIVFQDSIQKIEGFDDFEKMCNRLTKRCKSLHMEILHVSEEEGAIMLEWIMTMSFRRSPKTAMYGATKLTLNKDGLITHQRDYYDLWGDIFNNVPIFRRVYRWFMRVFFG
jgi:hypothetical protein